MTDTPQRRQRSLRRRLVAAILIMSLVPLLLATAVAYSIGRTSLERAAFEELEAVRDARVEESVGPSGVRVRGDRRAFESLAGRDQVVDGNGDQDVEGVWVQGGGSDEDARSVVEVHGRHA